MALRSVVFGVGMMLHAAVGWAASPGLQAGVNLSGMEIGNDPGVYQWDYTTPTLQEMQYYCRFSTAPIDANSGKHVCLFRLPIILERLEPELLTTKDATVIDPAYTALIQGVLANAASVGATVVIDMHDYGWFWDYHGRRAYPLQIGGTFKPRYFVEAWQQLAAALNGRPGLGGYDLMNEPNGMVNATIWPQAAQAAVDGIRKIDMHTPIYVEGDFWASAPAWTSYNATLNIRDPGNKIVYEAHVYGDRDDSGTHYSWHDEAANGVTVQTLAQRVQAFSGWCQVNRHTCMIGEVGVGNDSPNWNTELANGFAAMQAGGLTAFTYWAGGPWWGSYPLSIEPGWDGGSYIDAAQMAVVQAYAK